jgi:hypothetical protein
MMRVRRAWRWLRTPENFDLEATLFLCAVIIVCVVLGWGMRPSVSGPPQLPPAPTLNLLFPGPQPAPQNLTADALLLQVSNTQAELKLDVQGTFAPNQRAIHWTLAIENFTGSVCTAGLHPSHIGSQNYQLDATSPIPVSGIFLKVHLCWAKNSPVTVNTSYIIADLPVVQAPYEMGTVNRILQLSEASTYAYSLSEGIAPTSFTAQAWTWHSQLSTSIGSPASAPITVDGSSIVGVQEANDNTFYSGILFGIAGGAVISLLVGLPGQLKRAIECRDAKRKAAANGGTAQESTQGAKP